MAKCNTGGVLMRSQDVKVSQHSHFTCTVNFQPTFSKPSAAHTPLGDCLEKNTLKSPKTGKFMKKNERLWKLNTVHAKILECMLLANRYLQWRICLQEEKTGVKKKKEKKKKMTLNVFSLRFVWIDLSVIKHNYLNANQWASRKITSRHPETVINRR